MRVKKPWVEWDDSIDHRKIPGALGIFEIADEDYNTLYIGCAGAQSPFGLRGELFRHFSTPERFEGLNWRHPRMNDQYPTLRARAKYYRYEVNHQYYGRWVEALSRYYEDFGELPPVNTSEDPTPLPPLGRYHWKSQEAPSGA